MARVHCLYLKIVLGLGVTIYDQAISLKHGHFERLTACFEPFGTHLQFFHISCSQGILSFLYELIDCSKLYIIV
jgi:hypothetical protein